MVRVEPLGPGEWGRASELAQHLAVARATDVQLVEERCDRLVVAPEQLQSLERAVVGLLELLVRRRRRLLHAAIVTRPRAHDSASGAYSSSDSPKVHAVA